MAKTTAERQAEWRQRRAQEVADLREQVEYWKARGGSHAACDALEAKLRAEIATLKGQVRF
jgi:hypothetical protein